MKMLMDNQASIKQLESKGSMSSAKHVDVCMKFVCDDAKKEIVKPEFVESLFMKADILTKVLPALRMAELRNFSICSKSVTSMAKGRACDDRGGVLEGVDETDIFGRPPSVGKA